MPRLTICLPGDYKVGEPELLTVWQVPYRRISSHPGTPDGGNAKMIPPAFEYLRPKTIPEAIAFLQQYGDDAKILSGGQSLIPMMKFRLARPGYLIDINRISGLSYIKEEDGFLKIGGLTREAELEDSPLIHAKVSHSLRYRPRDRRSASAEHGDAGGQPGARRSGQRSSGHHAGSGSAGRGRGATG